MKHQDAPHLLAVLAVVLLLGASFGCDDAVTDSLEIAVTPPSITLTNDRIWVVTFRAGERAEDGDAVIASTNLLFPLSWKVSDASLGTILSSEGASAIFQSTGRTGVNIVTVEDQGKRIGQSSVIITVPIPSSE